jgi:hypothetical protein
MLSDIISGVHNLGESITIGEYAVWLYIIAAVLLVVGGILYLIGNL